MAKNRISLHTRNSISISVYVLFLFSLIISGPTASLSGPIEGLKPGEWYEVPNSRLDQSGVFPPSPVPEGTPAYIVDAWSGGAYDTTRNRFMIWGGGHGDYSGNEIYTFVINTLTWSRIWGPSSNIPPGGGSCYETYADGNPASRHTYDGLVYLPTQDKFWSAGGSLWCGSGGGSKGTWMFNLSNSTWERNLDAPFTMGVSVNSDYYSVTGTIIHENSEAGVINEYNPANNSWTLKKSLSGVPLGTEMSAAIDPINRFFVVVGNGYLHALNLQTGQFIQPSTSGGSAVINTRGPGLVYDPVIKKIVGWPGGKPNGIRDTYGDTAVYSLDVNTWTWTKHTAAPTNTVVPTGATRVGVFGRFQYIPSKNVYILMNSTNENVYIYKLSSGAPPPSGQINIPNKTWVAKDSPVSYLDGPCPGSNCKHMRLAYNPDDKRIYFLGGDYSGGPYYDTGRMEVWSYSIFDNNWIKEHDYCGPNGSFQPAVPDQVGWAWDSLRNKFWMIPGYQGDPTGLCSGVNMTRWKMATFNPVTKTWTDESARDISAGTGESFSFMQYDVVSDTLIRFTGGNDAQIYNINLDSWSQVNFAGEARFGMEYSALDPATRRIYLIDWYEGKLYRYDIAAQTLTYLTSTPASVGENSAMPIWDSVNGVLLWPRIASFSNASITLYIYHPDTNTWETDNMYQPDGHTVVGNSAVFDPQQNALLVMGDRTNPNDYFFLYRYGTGSVPLDTTPPSTPTNPFATAASSSQINLSWTASTDADSGVSHYKIYRNNIYIGQSNTISYSDTSVSPSTTYTYQVSAVNGAGLESTKSASTSATTPIAPPSLISNLSVASGKTYKVIDSGLQAGALVYIDRIYTFSNIPTSLQGKTYIQTANDDKASTGSSFLTFNANQNVTVYVAHDDRNPKPLWLSAFTDTGIDIYTSDTTFSLYIKDFPQGAVVTLGGNEGPGGSMYFAIIVPKGVDNISPSAPTNLRIQ